MTESSPTESMFPSCISPDLTPSTTGPTVTGPTAFPFSKSKTILFGRTNSLGKSTVRSLVKNLQEKGQNNYITVSAGKDPISTANLEIIHNDEEKQGKLNF